MEKSLDELLELIKDGKISIREASRQSDYSRDYLKKRLFEKYGTDDEEVKKLEELMKDNKANSTTVLIDPTLMEDIFLRTMNGEITLTQAREELGGIDVETLKWNFLQFIKDNADNEELLLKYKNFRTKEENVLPRGNYRLLAIEMIRNRMNQSQLAEEIGVPPRTISREFDKFKDDEDRTLYDLIKFYNSRITRKPAFTREERIAMIFALNVYEKRHPELLSEENTQDAGEDKSERMNNLVAEEEKLKKQGLTQAQIADELGTSVSGLRRARIFVEEEKLLKTLDKKDTDDSIREK